jgi:hypothetical protein
VCDAQIFFGASGGNIPAGLGLWASCFFKGKLVLCAGLLVLTNLTLLSGSGGAAISS